VVSKTGSREIATFSQRKTNLYLKIYQVLTRPTPQFCDSRTMRRAFVIQLDSQPSGEHCKGRIEHVDSGQSRHFHSLAEAVTFARRVLSQVELEEQESVAAAIRNGERINDK
jgi:hypothetical protein